MKKKKMIIRVDELNECNPSAKFGFDNTDDISKENTKIKKYYESKFPEYEIILVSHDVTIVDDNKVVDDILLG